MKLLIYSPQFLPQVGGLQYVAGTWAEKWVEMGNSVTVICHAENREKENVTYRVLRFPSFDTTVKEMRNHDVVVMFNVSLKALPQWLLSGKPLVISHHSGLFIPGNWKKNILQHLKKAVAEKLASANMACSAFTAAAYSHCFVVYSPFNSALFKNYQYPTRKTAVIFTGRLVTDKGCDLLIEAIARIRKKGLQAPPLTVIGNGPEMPALKTRAAALGISDLVTFKGFVQGQALVEELNQHSMAVIPSRLEPFGIVVLEALACGCSIIVSNTGGLPEAAGDFGCSFASEDIVALSEAIEQAMAISIFPAFQQVEAHLNRFTEHATAARALDIIKNAVYPKQNPAYQ